MYETPVRTLSPLIEAGGSVVGGAFYPMWWMHLLGRCLHLVHFLDYFHFIKFLQFLYLILHCLPYRLCVLHCNSFVTLERDLKPVHIQQVRKLIVIWENGMRMIVVLKKINVPHPFRQWLLRTTIGSNLTPGCEEGKTFSRLYYFLLLFPTNHRIRMILYTSQKLVKHGEKGTTKG